MAGFSLTKPANLALVQKWISAWGYCLRSPRTTGEVSTMSPMELNLITRIFTGRKARAQQ